MPRKIRLNPDRQYADEARSGWISPEDLAATAAKRWHRGPKLFTFPLREGRSLLRGSISPGFPIRVKWGPVVNVSLCHTPLSQGCDTYQPPEFLVQPEEIGGGAAYRRIDCLFIGDEI